MKKLNTLKLLINIVFIVFIIIIMNYLYKSPVGILRESGSSNGLDLSNEGNTSYIKGLAFIKIVIILLYPLAIYYLKLSMKYFLEKKYFVGKIDMYFNWAGILLLTTGVFNLLFQVIITMLIKNSIIDFSFGIELIQTPFYDRVFLILIGLFFLFISKAFFEAKELKQENDLTI